MKRLAALLAGLYSLSIVPALGAENFYAGGIAGLATLSADGQSIVSATESQVSLYKPVNGPAVNLFLGRYFGNYVSLQGNYIWNTNDLTFVSNHISPNQSTYYSEMRGSGQTSATGDLLGYFRDRGSLLRPYLSVGGGLVHVHSSEQNVEFVAGSPGLPPRTFSANTAVLRVAVGIDIRAGRGFSIRYSFSESISENPLSDHLSPPGERMLKNFQNLWGVLKTF